MMKIYKKLAIISLIGSVLTIIGLITGILWSTIYSSIIHTVNIRIICYNFNQYLYLIYCFIAIIFNTYIYKLQALGSNTYSYVSEVIYV